MECKHCHIFSIAWALRFQSQLPLIFWGVFLLQSISLIVHLHLCFLEKHLLRFSLDNHLLMTIYVCLDVYVLPPMSNLNTSLANELANVYLLDILLVKRHNKFMVWKPKNHFQVEMLYLSLGHISILSQKIMLVPLCKFYPIPYLTMSLELSLPTLITHLYPMIQHLI